MAPRLDESNTLASRSTHLATDSYLSRELAPPSNEGEGHECNRRTRDTAHRQNGGRLQRRALDDAEYPLTVREAARFVGVSPQTVYLWVERKQIPHLRVMGRNIRFLKSDLSPSAATFKQEVGIGKTDNA